MALEIKRLRLFIEIAEAGALSHAAHTLNVSQSSLSHHIAGMEADLGVALFDRGSRGVALTGPGQRLYVEAKEILRNITSVEADIRRYANELSGRVSIGLPHAAASYVALRLMKDARLQAPRVELCIAESVSTKLLDKVLRKQIDCALVFNPPDHPDLKIRVLLEEDIYAVGPPEMFDATGSEIAVADLSQHNILVESSPTSAIIGQITARRSKSDHDIIEIESLSALRVAIEGGLGFGLVSRSSMSEGLAAGRLVARKIIEPNLTLRLAQVTSKLLTMPKAVERISSILTASVIEAVESGRWPARLLA